MNKICKYCKHFKNETCVNIKSPYAYQAVIYDVCIHWETTEDEDDANI